MNLEDQIRKILLLGKAPSNRTHKMIRTKGIKGYGQFKKLSDSEIAKKLAVYHGEGKRAAFAHSVANFVRDVDKPKEILTRERAKLKLKNARTLYYRSYHVHYHGATTEVEGYFVFDDETSMTLQVLSAKAFEEYVKNNEKYNLGPITENSSLYGYSNWIMVADDYLSPENVEKALGVWYRDRFDHEKGHWTNRENRQPTFTLDVHWEENPEFLEEQGLSQESD